MVAVGVVVAPAASADPPSSSSRRVVGDLVVCDDLVLTAVAGEITTHTRTSSAGGVERELQTEVLRDLALVDAAGATYTAHGSASHRSAVRIGAESGHVFLNVVVHGPDGPVGTVRWKLHLAPDGEARFADTGTCSLIEA